MQFMIPQVENGEWVCVNEDGGELWYPARLVGLVVGEPEIEERKTGWAGRLDGSGYLDCTDWTRPYDTEIEAMIELYELYANDEEDFAEFAGGEFTNEDYEIAKESM